MIKSSKRDLPTAEEIEKAFAGTNFGSEDPEHILKYSVLKIASGYSTGNTAKCILQELGLVTQKTQVLTNRGRFCLWEYFKEGYR